VGRALGAGALVGASVLVEYQLVLAALVLAVFLCVRHRRVVGWFAVGGAPFAVALMAYQRAAFGGLLSTSYAQKDVHTTTVAGWPKAGQAVEVLVGNRGLFVGAPVLLAAIAGLLVAWRSGRARVRDDALVGTAMLVAYWLLQAGWSNPWGGEMPGPRYVITALPFLAVGIAAMWSTRHQRIVIGMAAFSAVAMALPLITLHLVADGSPVVAGSIDNLRLFGVSPTIWSLGRGPLGWLVYAATVVVVGLALRRSVVAVSGADDGRGFDASP
jgi:hypothetical protein